MKRFLGVILAAVMVFTAAPVFAQEDLERVTVNMNGAEMQFDVAPIIENDRTLIPIRGLLETLGAKVEWDHDNYNAIADKDGVRVVLPIGSSTAYVNGEARTLDVPAELRNGRTMVPLRFILQSFGIEIEWEQETRTVYINTTEQ